MMVGKEVKFFQLSCKICLFYICICALLIILVAPKESMKREDLLLFMRSMIHSLSKFTEDFKEWVEFGLDKSIFDNYFEQMQIQLKAIEDDDTIGTSLS